MIAKIDGVMNGISVIGDFVGETLYYGPGAGGDATASAVVIVEIVRAGQSSPMLGFKKPHESQILKLLPTDEMQSEYYIRMKVGDKTGVLANIAKILADHSISIDTILQRPTKDRDKAILLCSTHKCKEKQIKQAISKIEALEALKDKVSMIRIED
jgi:homoserine dehydrogenase